MNKKRITFKDISDWMACMADEQTRSAIEEELARPDSSTSRHLAWIADPDKHDRPGEDEIFVQFLNSTKDRRDLSRRTAYGRWAKRKLKRPAGNRRDLAEPEPASVPSRARWLRRHAAAIAAGVLLGLTASLATTVVAFKQQRETARALGDLFELHVDAADRPAAWEQIWMDNYVAEHSPSDNVNRLRTASAKAREIIDAMRRSGKEDFEILTALKNGFGPRDK